MFSFLEDWSEQDETHIFSFFLVPFLLFFFSPSSFWCPSPLDLGTSLSQPKYRIWMGAGTNPGDFDISAAPLHYRESTCPGVLPSDDPVFCRSGIGQTMPDLYLKFLHFQFHLEARVFFFVHASLLMHTYSLSFFLSPSHAVSGSLYFLTKWIDCILFVADIRERRGSKRRTAG